jgi:DNA modification methylase
VSDAICPEFGPRGVLVLRGDATALPLPDASIDAVCTDPPYGLEFMGAEWDKFGAVIEPSTDTANRDGNWTTPPFGGGGQRARYGRSPGEPFQHWCTEWAREVFRVLRPGGHLLAFGGTRTAHRLVCGIEDAGFEVRDTITWIYASGFPKSLDVSKAIDRARNDRPDILRVTSWLADRADAAGVSRADVDAHMGTSDMGGWWLSRLAHRCAVPTWEQWQQLRSLLRVGDEMDAEVWRLNGRKGTPGEAWHERAVVGESPHSAERSAAGLLGAMVAPEGRRYVTDPATDAARRWSGWGTALKPASEPIVVARKPLAAGTVAANVLEHGAGALNIDGCRVATSPDDAQAMERANSPRSGRMRPGGSPIGTFERSMASGALDTKRGRWPSNVVWTHAPDCDPDGDCVAGCPVAELDAQAGIRTSGANPTRRGSDTFRTAYGDFAGEAECIPARGADSGEASRFFPVFRYEPKAPSSERPADDDTQHPTVKPVDLMRWLVRLVTPPGGRVLDCFAGSGTTGEAALLEGFGCVLVEKHAPYLPLIRQRLAPYADPATLARARGRGVTPRRGRRTEPGAGDDLLSLLTGNGAP